MPEKVAQGPGRTLVSDLWGGIGAMLVALPSAIAFGVTVYSPLGEAYAARGALAGILGATALGLVAPALGGTNRLITAPCAPAAAILAALAVERSGAGMAPAALLGLLVLVGAVAGLLQIVFGALGLGRLIKYMPYPVVSGYLTGVGLILVFSQLPKFLGAAKGSSPGDALRAPALWNLTGLATGMATVVVMLAAPKLTRKVPAAILGLAAGVLTYFGLAWRDPALLRLGGNPLVIGALGASSDGFLGAVAGRWEGLLAAGWSALGSALVPGATLAVLLSIDTLKTCVVLDALTRSRHDSNRELVGQGVANLAASTLGGIPGAGTMGATLVNVSSGGQTRLSGVLEGALSLAAFLFLGSWLGWLPIAALAGILIVIGLRMIDWHSFSFLRNRSTLLDFLVIAAVVIVAVSYSLVAASGVGVALAIVLFVREQIGGSVVHRRSQGDEVFSRQIRLPAEMKVLHEKGSQTAIFELQGSLFFGTTDQLYRALEADLATRRYLILDLRRTQAVDLTAAHMLERIEDALAEREGLLLFSAVPRSLPSGRNMQRYFDEVGLARSERRGRVFDELDQALEWVEDRILEQASVVRTEERTLELREIDLFAGRKEDTLAELEACLERRSFRAGEKIFGRGDPGDELYLIRRGAVRVLLPLAGKQSHHLATIGRGDFFGEMSFLDPDRRSADAVAQTDTELFVLSRGRFDELAERHRRLAGQVLGGLARVLAVRLRFANAELRALRDPGGQEREE